MKLLAFLVFFIPSIALAQNVSPSEGYLGSPIPYYGQMCAAEDPSGNLRALSVDGSGNLQIGGSISASNPSVSTTGTAVPASATMIGGSDGTNLRAIKTDASGDLQIDVLSSALPTGAATEATLSAINTKTPALVSGRVPVDGSGVVQPVKPPPLTGTAFTFNGLGQNAEIANLDGQDTWTIYVTSVGVGGAIMCFGSPDPASVVLQSVPAVNVRTGETSITITEVGLYRVNISGFTKVRLEVTAYTSGTISGIQLVSYGTSTVSLNSPLPSGTNIIGDIRNITGTVSLPTGASTEATQLDVLDKLDGIDGEIGAVENNTATLASAIGVDGDPVPLSVSVVAGSDGTNVKTLKTDSSGTLQVALGVPAALTVKQAAITVGTSAVRATTDGSAPSSSRVLLAFQLDSASSASCYFGSSSVASSGASRGVQVFPGQTLSFNNDAGDYYLICGTAGQTFYVTEQE